VEKRKGREENGAERFRGIQAARNRGTKQGKKKKNFYEGTKDRDSERTGKRGEVNRKQKKELMGGERRRRGKGCVQKKRREKKGRLQPGCEEIQDKTRARALRRERMEKVVGRAKLNSKSRELTDNDGRGKEGRRLKTPTGERGVGKRASAKKLEEAKEKKRKGAKRKRDQSCRKANCKQKERGQEGRKFEKSQRHGPGPSTGNGGLEKTPVTTRKKLGRPPIKTTFRDAEGESPQKGKRLQKNVPAVDQATKAAGKEKCHLQAAFNP